MIYVFLASVLAFPDMIFYKTIVTGEWRHVVPNESAKWYGVVFYHTVPLG